MGRRRCIDCLRWRMARFKPKNQRWISVSQKLKNSTGYLNLKPLYQLSKVAVSTELLCCAVRAAKKDRMMTGPAATIWDKLTVWDKLTAGSGQPAKARTQTAIIQPGKMPNTTTARPFTASVALTSSCAGTSDVSTGSSKNIIFIARR